MNRSVCTHEKNHPIPPSCAGDDAVHVLSMTAVSYAEESGNVQILFLNTSDMHGQQYATDYTADVSASGTYRQGWTRVASYLTNIERNTQDF